MTPEFAPPDTVQAAGLRWRVQRVGSPVTHPAPAPVLLLLHGTGSSLGSWRACVERLAPHFRLVVPDLPGHGGTSAFADRCASLPRMAQAIATLLRTLEEAPALVAGHSAGAAVAVQLALDGQVPSLRGVLAVNGALEPLPGLMGLVAPTAARLASRSSLLPDWVTRHASQPRALRNLIHSTGSRLDASGVAHYRDLLSQPDHVRGVLDMLANWRLESLRARLPSLQLPLWLAAGLCDRTTAPVRSLELARWMKRARFIPMSGLGHLAHEEAPEQIAALLLEMRDQLLGDTAADTAA
ncbi:alpha/beta fold hydrolase BchO [Roseateles terrae]|uniref:Magnesium chelatase accessory protein n=1 Tax=Roseateles terrae TaxID=431060 RepID=A0ABR6GVQ5_9BURK|nr:alpha/beta fold hydrolase BchO [Roseateles terrae]MBB3195762.1 magnesium chelatase accessory protein [Roseateles terrae]